MTANTGRTVSRYTDFRVDDSAGTLRSIPVDSINGVGLTFDEVNVTAFQDAIKNALLGHPGCTISITGPFDTGAAQAAGTLSGSHTILNGIVGVNTPLSLDVQVGIRHAWESGEPQFGITSSSTSGFLCSEYVPDINNGKYSAKFVVVGSVAPAWGTAAES
jgi:hypothetical protein